MTTSVKAQSVVRKRTANILLWVALVALCAAPMASGQKAEMSGRSDLAIRHANAPVSSGIYGPSNPNPGLTTSPVEEEGVLQAPTLLIPPIPPAFGPVVFPDFPLGVVGTFNFEEPLIRVNTTDPDNVVATSHRGIRVSNDNGATFEALQTFPNLPGGFNNGDTAMDFDSQGRLFWATLAVIGDGDLQIAEVDPTTGLPIGATVNVQAVSGDIAGFDDKEFLAADRFPGSPHADNLYLVWTKFGVGVDVFFSRSANQGAAWSLPIQLSNIAVEGFPWPSDVAVASNGDVYAAYHSQPTFVGGAPDGVSGQTFVLRSTDGGVTFPQKTLAFGPGESDLTFNVQSAVGAIPQTQFWTQGSVQPWILPDAARPGQVYVVTNDDPDNVHGTAGDDADVVIARSLDNGLTWATATIPDGSGGAHQLFPFAAIDDLGNIAVAWFDTRRGLTNGNGNLLMDVFATYSLDGGLTWEPAFMVNDPGNPFDPDFPGNQRRFPTPQITPCDASPGSTETCRIGEYFGIDIEGDTVHVDWIGNTFDASGNVTGDQLYYSQVAIVRDSDGDGVDDDLDVCPETVIPEGVPTQRLGVNRWALVDDDTIFDTTPPPGGDVGPGLGFTVEDTAGCSCEQIIDALGLGQGHVKYGCSISAMETWVELVSP